ncbi:MAG TPA: hypothetical protein PLX97_07770, partial [Gemmatales bacterium]|nr:hypothetical protein [Gemmatales bacterium]
MQWVPFTVLNQRAGHKECRGMLYDEVSLLRLEYQLDPHDEQHRAEMKQVSIPVGDILSVYLMKGWLKSNWVGVKIVMQMTKPERFKDIPGFQQGRLELSVSKANAPLAEAFVYGLYGNGLA